MRFRRVLFPILLLGAVYLLTLNTGEILRMLIFIPIAILNVWEFEMPYITEALFS